MQMEAWVLGEPGVDVGVLVGLVVVDDQVQLELARELAVESAQELQELLVAVAGQALRRSPTRRNVLSAANRVVVPCRL